MVELVWRCREVAYVYDECTVSAEMISTFKCCRFEERTLWCSGRVGLGRAMIEMSPTGNSITKIYFSVSLTEVDLYVTVLGKGTKKYFADFLRKECGAGG